MIYELYYNEKTGEFKYRIIGKNSAVVDTLILNDGFLNVGQFECEQNNDYALIDLECFVGKINAQIIAQIWTGCFRGFYSASDIQKIYNLERNNNLSKIQ